MQHKYEQPPTAAAGGLYDYAIEQGRYFHVTGSSPSMIEDSINTAVEMARDHAIKEGWQGIVVTRQKPGVYTVAVSGTVPYGEILERDEWSGATVPTSTWESNHDADTTYKDSRLVRLYMDNLR